MAASYDGVTTSNISRRRKAALEEGSSEYLAKRKELVRVAAGIFRTKGYRATTFNDIAAHTEIDRATLYYYFGSKQEIFQEAIQGALTANLEGFRTVLANKGLSTSDRIRELVRLLMQSYHDYYPYLFVYLQQDIDTIIEPKSDWARTVNAQVKMIEDTFNDLIRQGMAEGAFRRDIPVLLSENAIFGMLNWTHRWYQPEGKLSPREIADAFTAIFFDGIHVPNAAVRPPRRARVRAPRAPWSAGSGAG